jgi:hypothetical protein
LTVGLPRFDLGLGVLAMTSAAVLLAVATLGVDLGWHRVATSGGAEFEWIIQIEPEKFATLLNQDSDVRGVVPPRYQGARRFRVVVGSGPVVRQGTPPEVVDAAELKPIEPPPTKIVYYTLPATRFSEAPRRMRFLSREPELFQGPALEGPKNASDGRSEIERASATQSKASADDAGPSGIPKPDAGARLTSAGMLEPSGGAWGWTVFGLLASLAGNVYLGWINWGQRERLHQLIDRFRLQGPRSVVRRRRVAVEEDDELEDDDER